MLGVRIPPVLPPVVDLRSSCGPIKDQGAEGSCTGHAFSSAMEWIFRKFPSWLPNGVTTPPVLSPAFFYAEELLYDGNFPNDAGSNGLTGCNIAVTRGCCEESVFPYVAGTITQPNATQLQNATQYALGAYHGLAGSVTAVSVLGDPTPWPVQVGFTVYASFESDATRETGVYNPQSGESVLGGHEVLMVGYDIGVTPTLRPAGCPPAALIQNSWGTGWGLDGFFWMPLSVLDASDTDLKIVHAGKPW
jgi:C1A family cysteine protease